MRAFVKPLVISVAVALVIVALVITVPDTASAASQTWTSDTDWRAGNPDSNIVIAGTGAASYLTLRRSDFPDWMQMAPTTVPVKRGDYCLAWVGTDNSYLMFGGYTSGHPLGDTWKYNFTRDQWTELFPATSPSNRSKMGCAYDPDDHVVVMFGGFDAGFNSLAETWHWDAAANNWVNITVGGLTPRSHQATPLTYDTVQKKIILETQSITPSEMQTWAYDPVAHTWTNRATSAQPDLRDGFRISYDKGANKVLLYAGAQDLTLYCDFWWYTWGTNAWNKIDNCVVNRDPMPGRVDYGFVYRDSWGGTVLYGGYTDVAYPPGTWYFQGISGLWFQPTITASPGGQRYIQLAHSPLDDATIFFGGYNGVTTPGGYQNNTWALAKGFVQGTNAVWTSSNTPVATGCDNVVYDNVFFNATKPFTTTVRFQLATSSSATGPWTFVGPGGLPGAYYNTDGQAIWNPATPQKYFRVLASLRTGNGRVAPQLDDVSVTWSCPPAPPYVANTNPVNGRQNIPINAPIWVNFSEPMQTPTVTWSIAPATAHTYSWSNNDTTLELIPSSPLLDCTNYTVDILSGKDQNENLTLVPGPVPNPWTFKTVCINPYVLTTDPANDAFNVALNKDIVVTFNEAMQTGTVTYTISPSVGLTAGWNGNRNVLTLSHTTAFTFCTVYTVQITAGLDDQNLPLVAGPVPNPWSFFSSCNNPIIVTTDPANGTTGVLVTLPITVTFSKAMNKPTVIWTTAPVIALTGSWDGTSTVLTLSHAAKFAELTMYTVDITAGNDTSGNPLVPAVVPNPWSFTTQGVAPFIVTTVPASAATGVATTANIVVTFSEPMNTGTVTSTVTGGIVVSPSWDPTNTVLTLTHATTPFNQCAFYTVTIGGRDLQNLLLVAGPVPNPWSFRAVCPLGIPHGLTVTKVLPSNIVLNWQAVTGATGYKVYETQNRFAVFPTGWNLLGTVTTPSYTHVGALTDNLNHFYIVRSTDGTQDSLNSTMGVKAVVHFTLGSANTNIDWFSLPYVSQYRRASDIATELGTSINLVGKWDPSKQTSVVYYFSRSRWHGTDFTISPGDGLYVGVASTFTWVIVGTDASVNLAFTPNPPPKANVNWVSIPYTGVYLHASDIANELGPSKVTEIGLWDPATQTATKYMWSGTAWTGSDFTITPGSGVYIVVASAFTWNPSLITPAQP